MTLPQGWVETTMGEITSKIGSGATPRGGREVYAQTGVPLIRSMNVRFGGFTPEGLAYLDDRQAAELDSVQVREDDVLLNITGASIGRVCVAPASMIDARVNQHVCIVRTDGVAPAYVRAFLAGPTIQSLIGAENYGLTRQALTKGMIEAFTIPIPPTAEQRRIVAKLDALTARIARARAELDRVPVLAENLRQSAVVAAFRGNLTENWRSDNPASAISDSALEAAFAKHSGAKRKKPAAGINWQPNFAIPDSWRWVSVDKVLAIAQYGTSAKTDDNSDGVPVLRMGNLQRGQLDWESLKYLPSDHSEFPELHLKAGDILFNRTNSFELVGKSAVFRGSSAPVSFASYLIRLKCSAILPDLLVRYLNSPIGREWVASVASQQVGQANVNGTKLRSLAIPLAPFVEQSEMNRILDAAFARADRLEAEATRARALLDRLESAILAKAFRGELVPQDPSDEPAGVLLERIRAARVAAPKAKRGRKTAA